MENTHHQHSGQEVDSTNTQLIALFTINKWQVALLASLLLSIEI